MIEIEARRIALACLNWFHFGMIRMTIAFILGLSVSGCVGFSTFLGTEESAPQFAQYSASRGGFVEDKNSAIEYWGEPMGKLQLADSSDEEWTYRGGIAWRGVVVSLIIPIPLMAPVGRNIVKMRFSPTGELIMGTAEAAKEEGVVCVLLFLQCNPELEDML